MSHAPALHTFPSGLTLVVQRLPGCPAVSVNLWVDAGAADEEPHELGAAHFVEHMLFKGTVRRPLGQPTHAIEALGGDVNAWTSHSQTVLHATVPAGQPWEEALDVLLDMASAATFHADEVERERTVILDEIRGVNDDPEQVLTEAVLASLWPEHPFGRPVSGTAGHVECLTREALVGWWQRHWVAGRIAVAVVGDVEPAEVVAAVNRRAAWLGEGGARRERGEPGPVAGRVACRADFDEVQVQLALPGPGSRSADAAPFDVLGAVLGGDGGLLHEALELTGLATTTWCSVWLEPEGGVLSLGAVAAGTDPAPAWQALQEVLAELREHGVSPARVRRAVASLLADALVALETAEGVAGELLQDLRVHGDLAYGRRWRELLAGTTVADVSRLAASLRPELGVVGVLGEQPLAPGPVTRRPRREAGPRRLVLDGGLTLVLLPDEGPMAAVRVAGLGGQLLDGPGAAPGAVWSRAVVAGAGLRDEADYGASLELRGAQVDAWWGRSTFGIGGAFPADRADDGLDLVLDALLRPRFDRDAVDRVVDGLAEAEHTLSDRPSEVARRLAWARLCHGHPYARSGSAPVGELRRVRPELLRRMHERLILPDNLVVAVAGPIDEELVRRRVAALAAALPKGRFVLPRRSAASPRAGAVRRRSGRGQARVLVGWPGLALADARRPALEVGVALLDRAGGRLFHAVREVEGLAYEVFAEAADGWDPGIVAVGLGTDPERCRHARDVLVRTVDGLLAAGPSADEVEVARRQVVGGARLGRQRAADRATEGALWERYGVPGTQVAEVRERELAAVTPEAVLAVLRALLDPARRVEVVVA